MFIFKRIEVSDCNIAFKTGFPAFDELNQASGTLREYLQQDVLKGGVYTTYILLETRNDSSRDGAVSLLGLCRYRFINDLDTFSQDLHQFNVSDEMLNKVLDQTREDRIDVIVYFSRIGVQENYQDVNVGTILSNFFEHIIKREKRNAIIYLKARDVLDVFLGREYLSIGQGLDPKWGEFKVKLKIILHR